jgi:4-diphosphocytidyl-2-C-methyl-D-erythritol kinase
MRLEKQSGCKINLLLSILGRRDDGFHALETVMHPVPVFDRLTITTTPEKEIRLFCNHPSLPTDSRNLVYQAAEKFREAAKSETGLRLDLEKHIPLSAGLGGGSANAATTLLGLNEIFDGPLSKEQLQKLAASLGSDVPFFLQGNPALATGRGELVQPLEPFPALHGAYLLLIHPGFGIPTAWAYGQLPRFPAALHGKPGRAQKLISILQEQNLQRVGAALYNSLEAPALEKYPLLALFQEFLLENGADGALMSGSGSSTFALARNKSKAEELAEKFKSKFGDRNWMAIVPA